MKEIRKIITLMLLGCLGLSTVHAQLEASSFGPQKGVSDQQARSITMNMGLPSNAVRTIVQDKDGFMWFGTDNGLCR